MSWMFEVYYKPPANLAKEKSLTERIQSFGGRFDYREEPSESGICLTYEFEELAFAEKAAAILRQQGEFIKGPVDYGS